MKIILTQSGRKQKFEIFVLLRCLAYIFQKHETQNDFKRSIKLSNEIGHHETNLWIISSGAQFPDKFLLKLFSFQIILFSISDSVSDVYTYMSQFKELCADGFFGVCMFFFTK